MKKILTGFLAVLSVCILFSRPLRAGGFRMNWSEVEVILDKDGKAKRHRGVQPVKLQSSSGFFCPGNCKLKNKQRPCARDEKHREEK